MNNLLNAKRVSLSLAIVTGIVSIICAGALALVPGKTMNLFGSIMHGVDLTKIAVTLSWGNAITGTITAMLLALVVGWLFAVIYNKMN